MVAQIAWRIAAFRQQRSACTHRFAVVSKAFEAEDALPVARQKPGRLQAPHAARKVEASAGRPQWHGLRDGRAVASPAPGGVGGAQRRGVHLAASNQVNPAVRDTAMFQRLGYGQKGGAADAGPFVHYQELRIAGHLDPLAQAQGDVQPAIVGMARGPHADALARDAAEGERGAGHRSQSGSDAADSQHADPSFEARAEPQFPDEHCHLARVQRVVGKSLLYGDLVAAFDAQLLRLLQN